MSSIAPFAFRRPTTVGQLREMLADLPDSAEITGEIRENPAGHCHECDAEPEWWDIPMRLDVMRCVVESHAEGLSVRMILRGCDDPDEAETAAIRAHFRAEVSDG